MKQKSILYYIILVILVGWAISKCNANSSESDVTTDVSASQIDSVCLYVAEPESLRSEIINYTGYNVSYNEDLLIPNWVSYELLAEEADGEYTREGKTFRPDSDLDSRQADNNDYKNSGWSRGHMAPAGDFKWSPEAMDETFYFTNCCPQNQSLNAGQWSTLEKKTRNAAKKYGRVMVVTGPIVGDNRHGTIGQNKVIIPDAFFKALMTDTQAIAFVMFNTPENENIQKCAMSVDCLEMMTGLDFFPEIEDDVEENLEAGVTLKYWGF